MIKYIAAFGIFGIITTEFGVIGILPQLAQHYHQRIDQTSLLLSAFALVIALFGPWITLLTTGYNRKTLMLTAIGLFIISNALSVLDLPFKGMLIARILPAFLHPMYFATALAVAVETSPKDKSHRAMSIIFGGVSLATVAGVPFATYMADRTGWQASFIVSGIVNILAWLSIFFFIPSMPVRQRPAYGQQLQLLTRRSFLLSAAAVSLLMAALFSIYSYFADYMQKVDALNGTQTSVMLMIFGITGIAGNWMAGKFLSRNVLRTIVIYLLSLSVIFSLLLFTGSYSPATMLLVAIWGFVHTGCFLIGQTWISMAAPGAEDFANSLGVSFGNLGLTLGTALSGRVIAGTGIHQIPWVSILLVITALILILAKARRSYIMIPGQDH